MTCVRFMNCFAKLRSACSRAENRFDMWTKWWTTPTQVLPYIPLRPCFIVSQTSQETREGARNVYKASTHTSSNIGIGLAVGGAIGAGVGTLLGPVGIAAIGSATAVVGGAIAKGVNVLKQRMVQREARKAGIDLDED
jgi:hypothetical protein